MNFNFFKSRPLFYLAILFGACIFIFELLKPVAQSEPDLTQKSVFIGGTIVSEIEEKVLYQERRLSFILDVQRLWTDGKPSVFREKVKVHLPKPGAELSYGDEVVLEGRLVEPESRRNPGGFDQKAYLANAGITWLFFGDRKSSVKVLRHHRGNAVKELSLRARKYLAGTIESYFNGRDAVFLKALFIGERSGLDEDFKDLFIKTGTMHILAVSGFNIGFLTYSLFLILRAFFVPRNVINLLMIAAVWSYCLVVGWQAPVVRASVMASLFILSRLLGRNADLLNLLGASAIVILVVKPLQIFDLGFQLSFLAVLAIICVLPQFLQAPKILPNEKVLFGEKVARYFQELFWISFVCIFATLPVTVQNFYIVTPLALVANLVAVPLSFGLFFLGFILFLTHFWVPKFLQFMPYVMVGLMKIFTASLFFIENLPGAYWIVGKLAAGIWIVLVGGLGYLFFSRRFTSSIARAIVVLVFSANIFLLQALFRQFDDKLRVTMLDVGQGDALFFKFPHGPSLLVDAGKGQEQDKGRYVIAPFLRSQGIDTLDALMISHPQEDHIGGMESILKDFKVNTVIHAGSEYPTALYQRLKEEIVEEKARALIAREGDKIDGFPDTQILVFNPPKGQESKNINNDSLVVRIAFKETSFLMTGDIEEKILSELAKNHDLRSDVLKVPHHGAKLANNGNIFLQEVDPKFSLISVGKRNRFKHPNPHTISLLNNLPRNRTLRTDLDHAIQLVSNGQVISLVEKKSN